MCFWTSVAALALLVAFLFLTHKPSGLGSDLSWVEVRLLSLFESASDGWMRGRDMQFWFNYDMPWRKRLSPTDFYGAMSDLRERGLVERRNGDDEDGLFFVFRITGEGVDALSAARAKESAS